MRARLAWSLVVLTAALVIGDTLITAAYSSLWSEHTMAVHGWPYVGVATLGSTVMGALIISRYPGHLIGWLLSAVGATGQISLITEAYSIWVIEEGGPGPAVLGHVAGWISVLLGAPLALTGLTIMFLVSPDGRLLSPRWRYAAAIPLTGLGLYVVAILTLNPTDFELNPDPGSENDNVGLLASVLLLTGIVLVAIGLIAAVVSMVKRLRRARGDQRLQLRWIVAAASCLAFSFGFLLVVQAVRGGEQSWLSATPLFVSYALLPVFMAIAVLHHRLYDIDVIINRALVVAAGTAFAAIGYVGIVVAVAAAVGSQTGGFWPSLLASAVVAVAFQPLRRQVVRWADRLAFGRRAAPYEALADFSRQLGGCLDSRLILPAVAEAAGEAVAARRSTVLLRLPGSEVETVTWPVDAPAGGVDFEVPVTSGDEVLGSIVVTQPAGRSLRESDERLLRGLADQAAMAFRNAALDAELAGHIIELDRHAQRLAESRRRIVEARDSERSRLESAISREVIAKLDGLPAAVDRLQPRAANGAIHGGEIEPLLQQANQALASLRELTRGVFPTQLTRAGLAPALMTHLGRRGLAGRLHVDSSALGLRFPARAEAAAYFCFMQAIGDETGSAHGDLSVEASQLVMRVRAPAVASMDVQAMMDRVEAVGGSLSMNDAESELTMEVQIPVQQADTASTTVPS